MALGTEDGTKLYREHYALGKEFDCPGYQAGDRYAIGSRDELK